MKEITITIGEGEDILSNPYLNKLLQRELPFKFNYWLNRAIKKIHQEIKDYIKAKQLLVDKYVLFVDGEAQTVLKDNMKQYQFPTKEDENAFRNEIELLRNDNIKLSNIEYLKIDEDNKLFDSLSGHELQLLMPLMEN